MKGLVLRHIAKEALKRQIRWSFEGRHDEEVVFPECFVKLSYVDALTLASDIIEPPPSLGRREFRITQYHTMFDTPGEARASFDRWDGQSDRVNVAQVNEYDGCGTLLNRWTLGGVKMTSCPEESEVSGDDHIIVTWLVTYETVDFQGFT